MTMSTAAVSPAVRPSIRRPSRLSPTKLFYPAVSALLVVLTAIGFRHFYFQGLSHPGRPITPPIRGLIITHGIIMTAWLLLFLVQPLLIATDRRKLHMKLGVLGIALAAAVLLSGLFLAVNSARVAPPDQLIWGLTPRQFMTVPFCASLLFATFVGLGLWFRRRPDIHRPMMLTGTMAAMAAPISRIDPISGLYLGTAWESLFGPFFATQVLFAVLLVVRCAVARAFDRWFAAGFAVLTLACLGVMRLAPTQAWASFTSILVG